MANITQTIHSLNAGISQQPDEQKIPGQVKDMLNAVPDITQGLLKRPAGKFVKTLVGSTNTGKWFHYYRDENEQYVGQIQRDGTVKMWDCLTGDPRSVVDATVTRASMRAATQLVSNGDLVKLLQLEEQQARATAMEFETEQGDHNFMGFPQQTNYRGYQPYKALIR